MTLLPNGLWELVVEEHAVSITKKPEEPLGYGPTITQYTKREIDGVYQKFVRIGHKRSTPLHPTDSVIKHRVEMLLIVLMMREAHTPPGVWHDMMNSVQCWVLQDAYDLTNEWTLCEPAMPFPGDRDY